MDGIAILFAEFEAGRREFKIEGIQPAGTPQMALKNHENCLEVMTGAVLPENTDIQLAMELSILGYILIGTQASPLRRALIDLGMGLWLNDPAAKVYGARLRDRGKKGGVIACAMANRANRIAYALVRDQRPYNPSLWVQEV